jgi:4-amino-4-deoxy-L-arabinose transferase-like glycosyltransferase
VLARIKQLFMSRAKATIATIAGLVVIIANWSGVSWSWDSTDYVAAGRSISKFKGSLDVSGLPMTVRPPGYPALIAVGEFIGLSTNLTLLAINMASAVVCALCVYAIVVRCASQASAAMSAGFVALTPTMMWQTSMAWSEPPYIAALLVTILVALFFQHRLRYVVLTALYVSLFFLRFVGPVFIAPIIIVAVVIDAKVRGWIRSILFHTITLGLSIIPMVWWLARNHRIDGTLTGARTPGGGSFWETLTHAFGTYGTFITAQPFDSVIYERVTDYPIAAQLGAILAFLIVVAAGIRVIGVSIRSRLKLSTRDLVVLVNLGLVLAYTIFSAYRFVHFELGRLDTRMMVPLLPSLVIITALLVENVVRNRKQLALVAVMCSVALLTVHGAITLRDAARFGTDQRHLSGAVSRNLDLHKFVRSLGDDNALYSNAPQMLFLSAETWPIYTPWQVGKPWPTPCTNRYAVYYNDFQVQDNRPTTAPIVYEDPIGTVYDVGLCSDDINLAWD